MYLSRLQILFSILTVLLCATVIVNTDGSLRDTNDAGGRAKTLFSWAIITAIACLADIAVSALMLLYDNLRYTTVPDLAIIISNLRLSFAAGMFALAIVAGSVAYWLIVAFLIGNSFLGFYQSILDNVEEVRAKRKSEIMVSHETRKSTPGATLTLRVVENILLALNMVFLLFSLFVGFEVFPSIEPDDFVNGSKFGCAVFAFTYNLADMGKLRLLKDPIFQDIDLRRTRLTLNLVSIMLPVLGTAGSLFGALTKNGATYWAFLTLFVTSLILQALRPVVENLQYMKNSGDNVPGTDQVRYELVSGEQQHY